MRYLKIDVRQENGYSPFDAENNRSVTNDVTFAYAHEKLYILLSVLIMFFFFYDFNLNNKGFVFCILKIC